MDRNRYLAARVAGGAECGRLALFVRGDPLLAMGVPELARRGPLFRFRVSMDATDRTLHAGGGFFYARSASRNAAGAPLCRTRGPLPGFRAHRERSRSSPVAGKASRSAHTVSSIAYDASRSTSIVPRIACHHPPPAGSASSIAYGEAPDARGGTPGAVSVVRIACDETVEPSRVIWKG